MTTTLPTRASQTSTESSPRPGEVAIRCRGVTMSYGKGDAMVTALRGIDLDVLAGGMLMLVGPSGCGKTTLISLIAGILDRDAGECTVFGEDFATMSTRRRTHFRGSIHYFQGRKSWTALTWNLCWPSGATAALSPPRGRCKLAPSVVTKRLAALETRLGTRLFQRTTRRVSPTADGDTLCERAQELLRAFESAEAELRERQAEPSGPVRLAATFGFGRTWLGPALASFQSLYPKVTVQVHLTDQLPDLAVDGLDGAIWLWNAPAQRAGEWIERRLATNQRVVVAAPAYLRRRGVPRSLDELSQHDCLVVRENGGGADLRYDHWRLQRSGERQWTHTPVRGPLSSNSGELVRDRCLAGHGIMLRSLWDVAPLLERGELVRVLDEWRMPDADIHWIAPYRAQVTWPKWLTLCVSFAAVWLLVFSILCFLRLPPPPPDV